MYRYRCPGAKTVDQLVLRCALAHEIWDRLGVLHSTIEDFLLLQFIDKLLCEDRWWMVIIAACAIELWKVRSARDFDGIFVSQAISCYNICEMPNQSQIEEAHTYIFPS